MKSGSVAKSSQRSEGQEILEENCQTPNQRVEYMLISKRIQNLKEDELISPTVDVTNYKKTQLPQQNNKMANHNSHQSSINTIGSKDV